MKTAKLVIIGESGVGKTCIAKRQYQNLFDNESRPTIGSGHFRDTIKGNKNTVILETWDTAGAEQYRALTPIYFKEAGAAMIVFDITSRQSFEEVKSFDEILKNNALEVPTYLVGNKNDRDESRQVTLKEGSDMANQIGAEMYIETSALTGENIKSLFMHVVDNPKLQCLRFDNAQVEIANPENDEKQKCGC
ncbi:Ras-related protein RABF1 [Tritrichomonas foetus]|uniref:Ras-related protein RABF1 n=1 Tax=Tritrichomonas foetus TaxID=1144522 RepID=A0A1J4KDE7_9EUKA|nr:Ras-related protein RABF1 [Tritrichomonas foetus]|eukprot:OHT07485.1 Ras-related protein RABF1 [Tritrichomonas foetus]